MKLTEITDVIRSKNAGPYELTFDIIFKTQAWFERAVEANTINMRKVAHIFSIAESDIISIVNFAPANAIKITIRRPMPSGALGETDVYGAQQHGPLLGLEVE